MRRRSFSATVCAGALLALCVAASGRAQAQSAVITGKVTGRQSEPLGGVIVLIEELGTAVATTNAGSYTLTVPADRTKGQTVSLRALHRLLARAQTNHAHAGDPDAGLRAEVRPDDARRPRRDGRGGGDGGEEAHVLCCPRRCLAAGAGAGGHGTGLARRQGGGRASDPGQRRAGQ